MKDTYKKHGRVVKELFTTAKGLKKEIKIDKYIKDQ